MSETKNVDAYGEQQTTTGCSTRVVIMPFFSVVICYQNGHGALETNASALFLLLRQVCLQQASSAHTLGFYYSCLLRCMIWKENELIKWVCSYPAAAAAAAHHWQAGVENKLSQVHGYKRPCIVIQDWKTNIIEVMSGYICDGGPTYSMRHKGA